MKENLAPHKELVLFVDTETSGFITGKYDYKHQRQAWVIQLGWIFGNEDITLAEGNFIVKSNLRWINPNAQEVHGISTELADFGLEEEYLARFFMRYIQKAEKVVCHNYPFDSKFIYQLFQRCGFQWEADNFINLPYIDTKTEGAELCDLKTKNGRRKQPSLKELYEELFHTKFPEAHSALRDCWAMYYCYYEMKDRGIFDKEDK